LLVQANISPQPICSRQKRTTSLQTEASIPAVV